MNHTLNSEGGKNKSKNKLTSIKCCTTQHSKALSALLHHHQETSMSSTDNATRKINGLTFGGWIEQTIPDSATPGIRQTGTCGHRSPFVKGSLAAPSLCTAGTSATPRPETPRGFGVKGLR